MNLRNRAFICPLLFVLVAVHLYQQSYSVAWWLAALFQFGPYPYVLYWKAGLSANSKQSEVNSLRIETALFGAWSAALGFPLWIVLVFFLGTVANLTLFEGVRGAMRAILLFAAGAVLARLSIPSVFTPDTSLLVSLMAFAILSLHVIMITRDAFGRTNALRVARRKLREANLALDEQNRAKTRFLAYAGHDLRQPLQAMRLFLSTLSVDALAQQKELIRLCQASADSLAGLLDSLLDISRLDAGAVRIQVSEFDIGRTLTRLFEEHDAAALRKGLSMRLRLPPGQVSALGDERLVATILMNLIGNAIKYTDSGGVLVSARRQSDRLLIQVWDTGIGMASEVLEHIFEDFYQAANSERDRSKGLGLGLSIVRRLSNLLDLKLAYRSVPGRGTVVSLTIQLIRTPALEEPSLTSSAVCLQGRTVVIVEDTPDVATSLTLWFESKGATVRCFPTSEAALAAAKIRDADYYLSDFRLPGQLSGADFLDRISQSRDSSPKAALLTGDTSPDFIKSISHSSWPVLFKPVSSGQLLEFIGADSH